MFGENGYYQDQSKAINNSNELFGDKCEYWSYTVADMKMLHLLLGKCSWSNQHGSNLLCGCSKRVGVKNNHTHKCQLMSDDEHAKLYENAKKVFQDYLNRMEGTETYEDAVKEIQQWSAESNSGITGFGIDPKLLPISRIRPDVFHMMMGIAKRILKHLQSMLEKLSNEVRN